MKKTMLTYRILDRLESVIDCNVFSESGIEEIEHLAYCSAMSAGLTDTKKSEWEIFCGHFFRVFKINLEAIEEEMKKRDIENEAYEAFITESENITVHNITESEKMTVTVFTFDGHKFKVTSIDRDFYTEESCKFIA